MKFMLILLSALSGSMALADDDLSLAKSISEKLYVSMAQVMPSQLNEKDQLRAECLMRDLYITCVVTDVQEDVGYTHGITVKFDHYGRSIAVNNVQYFEH